MSPPSLFFFNIVLATWSSLKLHTCLSIGFSISVKLIIEVLIGITLYLSGGIQGSIPGSVRPSGEGNGNPLQYSCLENPMDRETCGLQSMRLQRVGHD